jgi:hypothetical protein
VGILDYLYAKTAANQSAHANAVIGNRHARNVESENNIGVFLLIINRFYLGVGGQVLGVRVGSGKIMTIRIFLFWISFGFCIIRILDLLGSIGTYW